MDGQIDWQSTELAVFQFKTPKRATKFDLFVEILNLKDS